MTPEQAVPYLRDEVKRSAPFSGHRDAIKLALKLVLRERNRDRQLSKRRAIIRVSK